MRSSTRDTREKRKLIRLRYLLGRCGPCSAVGGRNDRMVFVRDPKSREIHGLSQAMYAQMRSIDG